jgi:enoyl-CoA hydratase/carnithine racemase
VAADTARLGVPASRFSLLPGHRQHARMLQQLGVQVTRELMLTGRSFKGAEALRRGLTDYVCPAAELGATVDALVDDIISGAPLTVRNSKRMINTVLDFDAAGRELDAETIAELVRLTIECHTSQDIAEGIRAFFERRQPNFQGR